MSCEGSQGAFFSHQAGQSAVMAAFGGSPEQAQQALEQVYALARAQAEQAKLTSKTDRVATLRAKAEDEQAKAATKALFARMQQMGLRPPAHSKSGLPKRDAQYGYAAIERTLRAIEGRTALPSLAKQVRESLAQERRISAISITRGNLGRCENCGRFASRTTAHICPQTANAASLNAALMRRLGVPASAYPISALNELIAQAKSGDLTMRHNITGERVAVTLDGLMVAMRGGFVPESWSARKGLAQVELASGAIVPVLNATNLNQVNLSQGTGMQQAAAASGTALPVTTMPASATNIVQATLNRPIPSLQVQPVSTAQVSIDDRYASDYNYGHFLGTEFMKRADGSYGTTITADGIDYTIGDRYREPEHRSSARDTGLVPAAKGGVAVGRTLVAAAGLIKSGAIVVAERPAHDGQGAPHVDTVEVYSAGGHELIAACSPYAFGAKKGFLAADIDGNANASAEQMAAIIAYRALYPQTPLDQALAADLAEYINGGPKSAVAVADSAWITISDDLKNGGSLELGGGLGASRCPDCGRFMGSAHTCPNKQAEAIPAQAAPARPHATEDEPLPNIFFTSSWVPKTLLAGATQRYDADRFAQATFSRAATSLTPRTFDVDGVEYTTGEGLSTPADVSHARLAGMVPLPIEGAPVSYSLTRAAGLVKAGEVVINLDTDNDPVSVEIYSNGREELLSAYFPNSEVAGDISGLPGMAPEQMAAIIAYRAAYPHSPLDRHLAKDMAEYMNGGEKSAAGVADSAFLAIQDRLEAGITMELGARVNTQRCPDCGRFMGSAHNCPNKQPAPTPTVAAVSTQPEPIVAADPAQAEPAQTAVSLPEPAPTVVAAPDPVQPPQVNVSVNLDAEALASAIREGQQAPNVNVSIDTEALASAIKEGQQSAVVQLDSKALAAALKEGLKGVVGAAPIQNDSQLADSMNRLAAAVNGNGLPIASPSSTPAPALDDEPSEKQPRTGFQRDSAMPPTAVEHILKAVRLPAPDPYLSHVPESVGGNRRTALHEDIPAPDPTFEVNEQTERILRVMSATLQAGAGKQKNNWSRAFSVYGPPGTGKNSLARQLAASVQVVDEAGNETQGISYTEVNITPQTSIEEAIGTTILTKDPQSGQTVSRAQLGKIGLAAAMGSVICVNEIVRNPKLATALQSMLEDGEIQINSPEAGLIRIPVHPSTVFVMTWNPGLEGDAERPAKAPLERTIPLHLGAPTEAEQIRRLESFFTQFDDTPSSAGVTSGGNEQRRREILTKNYAIDTSNLTLSDAEKSACVRFFKQINEIAGEQMDNQQIGTNSSMPTGPGPRQLSRFAMLGKTVGWKEALETLRICCDQDDGFASQWAIVSKHFETFFGRDGQGLSRTQPQQRG
jgi:MoxR-like ATPase